MEVGFAGGQVLQKLETPRALCDCMAALVNGDLGTVPESAKPRDSLLPLYAVNDSEEGHKGRRPWLADVLKAMLKHAEVDAPLCAAQLVRAAPGLSDAQRHPCQICLWRQRKKDERTDSETQMKQLTVKQR